MKTPDISISDHRKQQAKRGVALGIVVLAVVGALVGLVVWLGALTAILYVFLFVVAVTFLPFGINLAGAAIPGATSLGKGHFVLAAFAMDHHYLVDRGDRWEHCCGDENGVYIDGDYKEITDGLDNKSVLGWRPFGILRYKDEETLLQERVDGVAEQKRGCRASADGGVPDSEVVRGGFPTAEPMIESGLDGTWVVDLKRVFTRGLKKLGDIEIIETTEEIVERGQVDDSRIGNMSPALTFFISIALGVMTGFAYVYMMG